ncbi:MAG TPA: CPBP family intramembrane glutamic endopeptidase, partial [Candidatus Sulfotelmatobacter sp.]|nr:CPBP family intramembrane glutamic endopeptidase [Candidatus Sulfotelmatobacter sp.]
QVKKAKLLASFDNPQPEPQPDPTPNSEPATVVPTTLESHATAAGPGISGGPVLAENPVWNGWDVLLIIGLAFATIFVAQFAILIGAHYLLYPRASMIDLAQRPILLLISQYVIDLSVVLYLLLLIEGKYHAPFGRAIRWNWPRNAWWLLLVGVVMLLVLSMVENLLPMPKDTPFEKLFERPRDAYLLAVIAVSLGPLVEELFFRGFFYPVLARRLGIGWAIFLTALPFALMHMPQYGWAWGALLVIFIVGVVCGAVRAVTKSVAASFLVHVGYNGSQMLIALFATRGFTYMPKALMALLFR